MAAAPSAFNYMDKVSQRTVFSRISILLSSVCVIHCLSFPVIIFAIPALAQFMSSTVEFILIISVIPISAAGFFPTWVKHKNYRTLVKYIGSAALMLIGLLAFPHAHDAPAGSLPSLMESAFIIAGALGMAWVMYRINKHTHVCSNPHHHH
jgi:hypothetical protein